eukprot:13004196-Alexandrium_andersonii.AAC.1
MSLPCSSNCTASGSESPHFAIWALLLPITPTPAEGLALSGSVGVNRALQSAAEAALATVRCLSEGRACSCTNTAAR